MDDVGGVGSPTSAGAQMHARTPRQALNFTRLLAVMLTGIAFLLTFVLSVVLADEPASWALPSALDPTWLLMLTVGLAAGAASLFIARALGRGAARRWAVSGLQGGQTAPLAPSTTSTLFGLDIGTAPSAAPLTLWDRFSQISIVGSAVPEILLLMGFVVTFMTFRWLVMVGSVILYFVFWGVNFPRRSQWDEWASSAGLTLPWDDASGSPAGLAASIRQPDMLTPPR